MVEGVPLFMEDHLKELGRAMEALELKSEFDFEQARVELGRRSGRWRWVVTTEGARTLFNEEEVAPTEPVHASP